jgi:hypothetical protein
LIWAAPLAPIVLKAFKRSDFGRTTYDDTRDCLEDKTHQPGIVSYW